MACECGLCPLNRPVPTWAQRYIKPWLKPIVLYIRQVLTNLKENMK